MKRELIFIYLLFSVTGISLAQRTDSTALIFNDTIIHRYALRFAVDGWGDSLAYNKEEADEEYMAATMVYYPPAGDSIVLDSVGVRYKGNSSYELAKNTPKKSFKFHFDKYIDDRYFYGCERLNFNNCVLDPSFLREKISYDIARDYMAAPRVAFATITINDTLIGLYAQVEQVDEWFLDRHFDNADGNLYKAGDDGAYLEYNGPNQSTYEQSYELKTNESVNDWSAFITMLYKLNNTPDSLFTATMRPVLDLDGAIRHLAWTVLLSHFDSYTGSGRNYYLYDNPATGLFTMIPWDLNLSFGQYANGWDVMNNSIVDIENLDKRPLNRRIVENDSLRSVYFGYLREMMAGRGSPDAVAKEVDRLKAVIDDAVMAGPEDNAFYSYEDFVVNTDSNLVIRTGLTATTIWGIKAFSVARTAELTAQLEAGAGVAVPRNIRNGGRRTVRSRYAASQASVVIDFTVPVASAPVGVTVLNVCGQTVYRTSTIASAGGGSVVWQTTGITPGIYLIAVTEGNATVTDGVAITR